MAQHFRGPEVSDSSYTPEEGHAQPDAFSYNADIGSRTAQYFKSDAH